MRRSARAREISDPRAVGREPGSMASRRKETGVASQRRRYIDAAFAALGSKGDPFPIGRKVRVGVVRGIVGDLYKPASCGLLHPDVQISLAGAVRCVSDERAVEGDRRLKGEGRRQRSTAPAPTSESARRGSPDPKQTIRQPLTKATAAAVAVTIVTVRRRRRSEAAARSSFIRFACRDLA